MSQPDEIVELAKFLADLADEPDHQLRTCYTMHRPRRPEGIYWQLRWLAGQTLRWLESVGVLSANPWPVSLQHAKTHRDAVPVILWAVGTDRDTLDRSIRGFARFFDAMPGFAPVLVTDVADFASFSRLGWLVEYVPDIDGVGEPFAHRKARFLAQLYKGCPALPATVGLASETRLNALRHWLKDRPVTT